MAKTYQEFAAALLQVLEDLGLEYAIGGSFASNAYGEPRTTIDVDISLVLPEGSSEPLIAAVGRLGYYVSAEDILESILHNIPFNIIDAESGYKADVFLVQPTPLEESVFARRRRVVYDAESGASAQLYSPEDVILYKLKYYLAGRSQKHLRDIAAMLLTQGGSLDYGYIERWARELDALVVWQQLLAEYRRRSSS